MTQTQLFLLPIFLHVLLTLYVGKRMVDARVAAVKAGEVRLRDVASNSTNWPEGARKIGNNYDNQFDLPTAWYAASAIILATNMLDWVFIALSWAFVAARMAHSYVHIGSNHVPTRKKIYQLGFLLALAMWAWLAVRLYVVG